MSGSKQSRVHWFAVAVVHLALVWCASATASAQVAEPSAEKGRELAIRLCRSCHLIENASAQAVPAGTLTFRGMATKPGQTVEQITAVLIQPHAPMPDIQLTRAEIDNIIAYLDALPARPSRRSHQNPSCRSDTPTKPYCQARFA